MSNKNNKFGANLGWFLLILVILTAIPIPLERSLLFLVFAIVIIFRIPRCLWDRGKNLWSWDKVEKRSDDAEDTYTN